MKSPSPLASSSTKPSVTTAMRKQLGIQTPEEKAAEEAQHGPLMRNMMKLIGRERRS